MNILQISFHTAPMNSLGVNDGGGLNVYVESISKELAKDNTVHIITGEQAKNMSKKNLKLSSFNLFTNQANTKRKKNSLMSSSKKHFNTLKDMRSMSYMHTIGSQD
jgi:hypothetical protein